MGGSSVPLSAGVFGSITVVDLSERLPGPYATRLLAAFGADVIKVERPDGGDRLRELRAMIFEAENRGKRSVALDLKSAGGRDALIRIVRRADVLVEGYRPGVLTRLGLGPDDLLSVNPKLIYVSISGYGVGPFQNMPGHDAQFLSFAAALPEPRVDAADGAAEPVPPTLPLIPVADISSSLFATLAIVLAVLERTQQPASFTGRHIDVGMADCALALMEPRIVEANATNGVLDDLTCQPGSGMYRTKDGRYVSLGAIEDESWRRLVTSLDLGHLTGAAYASYEQRCERYAEIHTELSDRIGSLTRDEAMSVFMRHDVPAAPVNSLAEPLADLHFQNRGMVYQETAGGNYQVAAWPVALEAFASRDRLSPPPQLGEHSRAILSWAGLSHTEIDTLIRHNHDLTQPTRA